MTRIDLHRDWTAPDWSTTHTTPSRSLLRAGCSISLSPQFDATGTWDGGVAELLGMIDMLLCNEEEAQRVANTLSELRGDVEPTLLNLPQQQSVDPVAERNAAHILYHGLSDGNQGLKVVVTLADRGAFVSSVQGFTHCPAEKASVVDACGAGDAFTAAFLSSWLKDPHDEESALREGCHAGNAALCLGLGLCAVAGAMAVGVAGGSVTP